MGTANASTCWISAGPTSKMLDQHSTSIARTFDICQTVILGASATNIKKLQVIQNKAIRIQNKAIRIAYKLHPLSHTQNIHEISKILLIKKRFQHAPRTFRFFQTTESTHIRASIIKRGHNTYLDKLISEYAVIYGQNLDCCVSTVLGRHWDNAGSKWEWYRNKYHSVATSVPMSVQR